MDTVTEKELFTVGRSALVTKENYEELAKETGFDKGLLILAVNLTYGLEPKRYYLTQVYSVGTMDVVSTFLPGEPYLSKNFFFDELVTDHNGWFDLKTDDLAEFNRIYGEGSEHS